MNKLFYLLPTFLFISLIFYPLTEAQNPPILDVLDNPGLNRVGIYNYTFNCEESNGNTITFLVRSIGGTTYPFVSFWDGEWIDKENEKISETLVNGSVIYQYQFTADGQYRFRAVSDYGTNQSYYATVYLEVISGNGSFVSGDTMLLVEKGRWVEERMKEFGRENWNDFKDWAGISLWFMDNPIYAIIYPFQPIPFLLLIWQVWVIVIIFVLLFFWYMIRQVRRIAEWKRYRNLRKGETLQERIRELEDKELMTNIMNISTEDALQLQGNWLERSNAYIVGINEGEIKWAFPKAHHLVTLALRCTSEDPEINKEANDLVTILANKHSEIPKESIYQDMGTCCFRINSILYPEEQIDSDLYTVGSKMMRKASKIAEKKGFSGSTPKEVKKSTITKGFDSLKSTS